MFSRRHYVAIAEILHQRMGPGRTSMVMVFVDDFADLFDKDSNRFDREKFVRACINGKKGG